VRALAFGHQRLPDPHAPIHTIGSTQELTDLARARLAAWSRRSNISDWRDDQLWKAYIQLTQAEAGPVWHQRTDRVEAHILVCFLAFVLWKTLETWRSRKLSMALASRE
jgi:hypothetical protein